MFELNLNQLLNGRRQDDSLELPMDDLTEMYRILGGGGFHMDMVDCGDSVVVEAELPGYTKEEIDVTVCEDCLTIKAVHKMTEKDKQKNYIRHERVYETCLRSVDTSGVDVEKIQASYENGILKLTMPKKAEAIPESKKIEIK